MVVGPSAAIATRVMNPNAALKPLNGMFFSMRCHHPTGPAFKLGHNIIQCLTGNEFRHLILPTCRRPIIQRS